MLSKAMDSHHLGRGRNSVENAFEPNYSRNFGDWHR